MGVSVKTFKIISVLVAFLAKEKVITILTHPTSFYYLFFTIKALIFLLLVKKRF